MASMFSFGFSGDDIEDDIDAEVNNIHEENDIQHSKDSNNSNNLPEVLFPAEKHPLEELTSSLPSQIAYNTLKLPITTTTTSAQSGQPHSYVSLGRREIFDVRTQLMAEDAPDHEELISGLEQGDLKPNFYEGGFKTWECALDLARLVLDHQDPLLGGNEDERVNHVVELGCGTAVPSLALFARLLSRPVAATAVSAESRRGKKILYRFTLADYNSTVLRMVTLPNLLLTWWLNTTWTPPSENTEHEPEQKPEEGELDIDSTLINAFLSDLSQRGISLDLISGGWSPPFVDLVLGKNHLPSSIGSTLVLASETIYSPSSLGAFSETLVQLLRRAAPKKSDRSRSLIAAKRVYFGVGGGIDEFLHVLRQQQLQGHEQLDAREISQVTSEGVGRVILEISIRDNKHQHLKET